MTIEISDVLSICARRQYFRKLSAVLGAAVGIPALLSRAIRHHVVAVPSCVFDTLHTDVAVHAEHLAAGIGTPALVCAVLLFQMRNLTARDFRKPRRRIGTALVQILFHELTDVVVVFLATAGYMFHSLKHEIGQTLIPGYWGAPRTSVQWDQLIVDFAGTVLFLLVSQLVYRKPLTAFSPCSADEEGSFNAGLHLRALPAPRMLICPGFADKPQPEGQSTNLAVVCFKLRRHLP